jgi:hypothetical protein
LDGILFILKFAITLEDELPLATEFIKFVDIVEFGCAIIVDCRF